MSETFDKIHLIDCVGLNSGVTQRALVSMDYAFEYHRFNKDWESFRASMSGVLTPIHVALLVDISLLHRAKKLVPKMLHRSLAIVAVGSTADIEEMGGIDKIIETFEVTDILESPIGAIGFTMLLHRLANLFHHQTRFSLLQRELSESQNELQKISDIGAALSSEENTETLLDLILTSAMEITGADAGSLYFIEEKPGAEYNRNDYLADKQLRFRYAKNFSRETKLQGFVMPITPQSIVGYVTISREPLIIPDVYFLPEGVPFKFGGRQSDADLKYRTKSMLTVPMLNRDHEPIGVIQLMNKKKDFRIILPEVELWDHLVLPFTRRDELFVYSLASQAGIAYENRLLYDSIKTLFEGFIRASVTAIERVTQRRADTPSALPPLRSDLLKPSTASKTASSARFASPSKTFKKLNMPRSCTTSAKLACANRCSSKPKNFTTTNCKRLKIATKFCAKPSNSNTQSAK